MKIIIIYKDIIVPERVVIDSYKKDTNFFNFRKIIKNNIEQKKLNFNRETLLDDNQLIDLIFSEIILSDREENVLFGNTLNIKQIYLLIEKLKGTAYKKLCFTYFHTNEQNLSYELVNKFYIKNYNVSLTIEKYEDIVSQIHKMLKKFKEIKKINSSSIFLEWEYIDYDILN
ncbi:hypothetical protein [Chryseobacterium culicis]|uniref:hypothetical protein n=1 Tax=Chryseobacterium culicis TaxID=680127 RepID=UPI0018749AE6|nr:hypothetical protein [Chryseobacterium culicis]MBE4948006.1 hypothetical protein [Chryseobacterium culicis]